MANKAPLLDNRSSEDLVNEARNLIPQFNPEWTNLNDSDPGMTLVKIHAWLTETLLYQINQLPDKNYDKFIELLGVKPKLATSAATDVAFTLKKSLGDKDQPLLVNIPLGAKLAVDDPELEKPLIFETARSLSAVNAAIGALIAPNEGHNDYRLVSEYNAKQAQLTITAPFYPFIRQHGQSRGMYLGIALRPHQDPKKAKDYLQDRWPEGELNLTVAAADIYDHYSDNGQERQIEGPYAEQSRLPHQRPDAQQSLLWSYFSGSHNDDFFAGDVWKTIAVDGDGRDFAQSGHVTLELPANIPLSRFAQLGRNVWAAIGALRPPSVHDELVDDLTQQVIAAADISDDDWQAMGVTDASLLNEIKSCCSDKTLAELLDDAAVTLDALVIRAIDWHGLKDEDPYVMPSVAVTPMIWLWIRPRSDNFSRRLFNSITLNTVMALARETFHEQKLGVGNGRPNQQFKLGKTPLLFDSDNNRPQLEVVTVAANGQDTAQPWQWQSDFYQADADSAVYTFDPLTQMIQFGDGIYGAIIPAGAQVFARRMAVGGGVAANVGRFTISKLKRAISHVDSVTNPLAAIGGRDTEPFKQTRLRAGHEIQHRDRAVTATDFATLTLATPTVAVHSAYALPGVRVRQTQQGAEVKLSYEKNIAGAVTVVFLPYQTTPRPQPGEAQIKAVCRHLNQKRLITTELSVAGPQYQAVTALQVVLGIHRDHDLKTVADAVKTRLLRFFHPVTGGRDNNGWPFGEDIYLSDIFCQILAVAGVSRAHDLTLELEGVSNSGDRIEIEPQQLIYLSRDVLNIKVDYEY